MTTESHSDKADRETRRVVISDIEGGIHGSTIAGRDVTQTITNFFGVDSQQQRALRNRQAMLKLVKDFWVKGVLKTSLHGAVLIELGPEERKDAVERAWDMVLQVSDQSPRSLSPGTRIIHVFNEMGQAL